jgi:endonuclease G
MARRSRKSRGGRRWPRTGQWLLGLNLAVAFVLGGWYLVQPEPRQQEVARLVGTAFERNKRVSPLDVAWDLWQLYYADSASGRIAAGDKSIVYGGAPRAGSLLGVAPFRVLQNQAYVVGYSESLGNPVWAAYRVQDRKTLGPPPARPDRFETDLRTVARVSPDDYTNSGYDRGHMAPNYAIASRHGEAAQRETFLMSNITPQRPTLNAGLWKELEMKIATSYPARYGEVWVLTGPVFGPRPQKLRGGVAVPEAFYLIVIDEIEGKLRTQAFLIPQDAPREAEPERFLTSIEEIQRRTGLDFLSELDDATERAVEARQANRVW